MKLSLKALCITMNMFEHRYYRLSKILMVLIGQWPYQSIRAKRGILAVVLIIITSGIVPQILAVLKYLDNRTMLLECIILYVWGTFSCVKLISLMVHSKKRLKMINLIHTDWQVWGTDREVKILHWYTAQGERLTILYTALAYFTLFVIMAEPLLPTIVDISIRNGTAPKDLPYPIVYYNIDQQKYYFYLVIYTNVCASLLMTISISNDVILITYVYHVCGIFAALGHKLERIGNNYISAETKENLYELSKKKMVQIASCVDRHNDAIDYANLIEGSYTRILLVTTGLLVILLNTVGLQVLLGTSDVLTFTRFICLELYIIFYLYMECYVSQILIDHSINICYYIYNSQWYRLSPMAQKNLQLMTMRSSVACQLTAGKMMVLSVKNFWLTMKTTISFFGFLRSTQGI